jgi:hypothetical protein
MAFAANVPTGKNSPPQNSRNSEERRRRQNQEWAACARSNEAFADPNMDLLRYWEEQAVINGANDRVESVWIDGSYRVDHPRMGIYENCFLKGRGYMPVRTQLPNHLGEPKIPSQDILLYDPKFRYSILICRDLPPC